VKDGGPENLDKVGTKVLNNSSKLEVVGVVGMSILVERSLLALLRQSGRSRRRRKGLRRGVLGGVWRVWI